MAVTPQPSFQDAFPELCVLCCAFSVCSEITAEGKRVTKLDMILLNGNNVALLVPGGAGPA